MNMSKRIRKFCQNPFPFLAQDLHPIPSFSLSLPPPAFLLMQPFLLPLVISWLREATVGLTHLEPRQRSPDLVRGAVANKGFNPFYLEIE
jgi:hypothetical protein